VSPELFVLSAQLALIRQLPQQDLTCCRLPTLSAGKNRSWRYRHRNNTSRRRWWRWWWWWWSWGRKEKSFATNVQKPLNGELERNNSNNNCCNWVKASREQRQLTNKKVQLTLKVYGKLFKRSRATTKYFSFAIDQWVKTAGCQKWWPTHLETPPNGSKYSCVRG